MRMLSINSCLRSAGLLLLAAAPALTAADTPPTFYRDVLPILQDRCQTCHRPGEVGPMPLRTFEEARPYAKAIKAAVLAKKMPPWFADPSVGHFSNDNSLPAREIATLTAWADANAPAGDAKDAPAPRAFAQGWSIGDPGKGPDMVIEMPEAYPVPARGTIEYTYVIIPTGFKEDRWVAATEFRPDQRAVMHHAVVFVRPPQSKWLRQYPVGKAFVPQEQLKTEPNPKNPAATTDAGAGFVESPIATYVPGRNETPLPKGYGYLIPAGSDIVLQLHYTTNGKAVEDKSRMGLVFAKGPVAKRVLRIPVGDDQFVIPAGAPNHPVSSALTMGVDGELVDLYPHMHFRGKAMNFSVKYPTGEQQELLRVPKYDFNWQMIYQLAEPLKLPKGTVMRADAWFDNSPNNKYNPDPAKEVRWGDQSWEEMMVGFYDVAVPANADLRRVIGRSAQ
jgi:hypothetical protein